MLCASVANISEHFERGTHPTLVDYEFEPKLIIIGRLVEIVSHLSAFACDHVFVSLLNSLSRSCGYFIICSDGRRALVDCGIKTQNALGIELPRHGNQGGQK